VAIEGRKTLIHVLSRIPNLQSGGQTVSCPACLLTLAAWSSAAVVLVWQGAAHHHWLVVVTFFK
jgi:hypothetical protein